MLIWGAVRKNGNNVSVVDILVPADDARHIHFLVAERLAERGHDVALVGAEAAGVSHAFDKILKAERRLMRIKGNDLFERRPDARLAAARGAADLRIDLTCKDIDLAGPVISPRFSGCTSVAEAARLLLRGHLPDVEIVLDGRKTIARAAPMADSRLSLVRGLNDILARTLTLLVDAVDRYLKNEEDKFPLPAPVKPVQSPEPAQLIGAYLFSMLPRQVLGAAKRPVLNRHRWNVSYRFHKGTRVAATGLLAGEPWTVLDDDGHRFYADPFPFEWNGRHFIFIEDFPEGDTKAVISVAEVFADGQPIIHSAIVEEPYHLSYPQVFSLNGQIWMLPEGADGGNLVLYRAEAFPLRWVRHATLIPGREIFDATLLEHAGRLWLFASERDGHGSASDMLVVYSSDKLEGPWTPHRSNPIRIDRAAARPGGGFVCAGDRIILPLQDGTNEYGGALGLADLLELNKNTVRLTTPVPILSQDMDAYPRMHTLNGNEHIEVIDRISPRLRRFRRSK